MAIIGFIVVILLGCFFVFGAYHMLGIVVYNKAASGRVETRLVVVTAALTVFGIALILAGFWYAPFTLSVRPS